MDPGAKSFTQLADKGLTADIRIATWCPTMDLLALSTADGQLCLHRLNWQRLWAVSPESPVTSLCWRPDGKVLACGYEDGYISLLDVENGDTLQRGKMVAGAADQRTCHSGSQLSSYPSRVASCQGRRQPLVGWKNKSITSYLKAAWHTKHVQPASVGHLYLQHLHLGQLPDMCTLQARQIISSLNGPLCPRG